jgi:hypothetical protein
MRALVAALALAPLAALGNGNELETQRSVIQRDQQSAEFAARVRGADTTRLEQLNARQLSEVMTQPVPQYLQGYQRQKMADERVLALPPPVVTSQRPPEKPAPALPLPSGTRPGVDPIPLQGPGY